MKYDHRVISCRNWNTILEERRNVPNEILFLKRNVSKVKCFLKKAKNIPNVQKYKFLKRNLRHRTIPACNQPILCENKFSTSQGHSAGSKFSSQAVNLLGKHKKEEKKQDPRYSPRDSHKILPISSSDRSKWTLSVWSFHLWKHLKKMCKLFSAWIRKTSLEVFG